VEYDSTEGEILVDILNEEGLPAIFARHARLSEAVRRAVGVWCDGGPLEFNATRPETRSNSITAVRTPEDLDAEQIRKVARETFDVSLGGGLADLAGRVFRIGHMGDLNAPISYWSLALTTRGSFVSVSRDWP